MAIDRRQFAAPGAVEKEMSLWQIAQAAILNSDFARAGVGQVDCLDGQRRAEGAADGGSGFHGGFQ